MSASAPQAIAPGAFARDPNLRYAVRSGYALRLGNIVDYVVGAARRLEEAEGRLYEANLWILLARRYPEFQKALEQFAGYLDTPNRQGVSDEVIKKLSRCVAEIAGKKDPAFRKLLETRQTAGTPVPRTSVGWTLAGGRTWLRDHLEAITWASRELYHRIAASTERDIYYQRLVAAEREFEQAKESAIENMPPNDRELSKRIDELGAEITRAKTLAESERERRDKQFKEAEFALAAR